MLAVRVLSLSVRACVYIYIYIYVCVCMRVIYRLLTWNGRKGVEGEYQTAINHMGGAALGAFRFARHH